MHAQSLCLETHVASLKPLALRRPLETLNPTATQPQSPETLVVFRVSIPEWHMDMRLVPL